MHNEREKLFRKDIVKTVILSSCIILLIIVLAIYDTQSGMFERIAANLLTALLGTRM